VAYYLTVGLDGRNFFGRPEPAPGARVVFDAALMFAAREQLLGHPVAHELKGDEGLVVHEDPRDELGWPCRLWEVGDADGEIRLQPGNLWFRSRAVTVVQELPGWLVFGDRGAGVAAVIDQASRLTDAQVRALAAISDDVPQLPYRDWSEQRIGGRLIRPIGNAMAHVHEAVVEAARATGLDLFAFDEVHYLADETWQAARSIAAAAALAAGTVEHSAEVALLARRWTDVVGSPEADSGS